MPLSLTGAEWLLPDDDPARAERLGRRIGLHPAAAGAMLRRGVQDEPEALRMLHPELSMLHDPQLMRGLPEAVARLRWAAQRGEHVRVVTDYDVDGTTSSLILQATLGVLGGVRVSYHVPDRMEEGYGFSVRAAEAAAADGVGLIVTADIGVRDHEAVARARELGVDVILCDHHLPEGEAVPERALAVLCPPQRGCPYPNKALAACGVSLKLAQALLDGHPRRDAWLRSLLKLAALGTVADVVDLLNPENRAIVALGLDALNRDRHAPGLEALLRVAGLERGRIGAADLGYKLGPRVNAAGRVASATAVIELLTTRDPALAARHAEALDRLNTRRRRIQDDMERAAQAQVGPEAPAFVLASAREGPSWHRGVAGVVASRLRDRHHRPAAVVAIGPDGATGSLRSLPELHALELLGAVAPLLLRYGGHPAAAGFSCRPEVLPELARGLSEATLACGPLPSRLRRVDVVIEAAAVDLGLIEALERLGPFGKGNPAPRVLVRGGRAEGLRVLKDRHLKASLAGARGVELAWWEGAAHRDALATLAAPELLGTLGSSTWQGVTRPMLTLEDARPGPA